jgi:Protein of unknown function (DUF3465)
VTNSGLRRLLQAGFSALLLVGLYLLRARSPASAPTLDRAPSPSVAPAPREPSTSAPGPVSTATTVAQAYRDHRSNITVEATGRVLRVLPEDRQGSRHERFLVEVAGGVRVLVAHNIDLAPRVPVTAGDSIALRGEYEWNDKGGVIHWTHRDPGGRHEAGWIRHAGRLYQ